MQHLATALTVLLALAADAPIQPLATGFVFTEGPAFGPDGLLYFTDQPTQTIRTVDPATGETAVFRENSGRANGLAFDAAGRLYACEGAARRVTRTEADGSITVVAERVDGKLLNSPNDIVVDAAGGFWFTDPRYGKHDDMELDVEGVYHVTADGTITCVVDNLTRPNGLGLSPDEKRLYVSDEAGLALWVYPIADDGSVGEGKKIAELSHPDGMCIAPDGTLYVTGHDGVSVFDPDGTLLRLIVLPEAPANCTLGPDGNLYAAAWKSVYRVELAE